MLEEINPDERKRLIDENNYSEPISEELSKVRALAKRVNYPSMVNNYPCFYEVTNLMHLAEKFRPKRPIIED